MKRQLGFESRLIANFAAIAIIPIIILGTIFYIQSQKWAEDIAINNANNLIEKDVMLINQRLMNIIDCVKIIDTDEQLNSIFSEIDPNDDMQVYSKANDIRHIIGNRIPFDYSGIVGIELLTSYAHYTLYDTLALPKYGYLDSQICKELMAGGEVAKWYPTYDSVDMFNVAEYRNYDFENRFIFTFGKKLSLKYTKFGSEHSLAPGIEHPILLIHFKKNYFESIFHENNIIANAIYAIKDVDGNLIYTSSQDFYDQNANLFLLQEKPKTNKIEYIENKKFVVSQAKISANDWVVISVVPMENVVNYFRKDIMQAYYSILLLICIIVIVMVYFSAKNFSKPIAKLIAAINKTSSGDFSSKLVSNRKDDFDVVFEKFNEMNNKLETLIKENYEIKLKDKDLEIQLLHLQFNPHFMYNTLNAISLMALAEGQDEISVLLKHFSNMIRYCVKFPSGLVKFSEDFNYIKSYVTLFKARNGNSFEFTYNIDEHIYDKIVPKFMLQPAIENAIIHGFEGIDYIGHLVVNANIVGDKIVFEVIDDGCGISDKSINDIFNKNSASLGMRNVDERIKFYYGNEYGVTIKRAVERGTVVTITIPN